MSRNYWRTLIFGIFTLWGVGLIALLLGFWFHGISPTLAWVALFGGATIGASAAALSVSNPEQAKMPRVNEWEVLALIAFAIVCFRIVFWNVYPSGGKLFVLLWNNRGDLAFHGTLSHFFANGAPFWPQNPILAGEPLGYPFGVDLIEACLLLTGVDWIMTLTWMGLIGSILTGLALFGWGRGIAITAFMFNGGLIPFFLFAKKEWKDPDQIAEWKNIVLALFATQRGLLFALPAGLLLLSIWRDRHAKTENSGLPIRIPPALECLLYGTMPFFHLHTFLFLSFILGIFGLAGSRRSSAWGVILGALIPASTLIWILTNGFKSARQIGWLPGWMQREQPFLEFWAGNFGLFLPLAIWTAIWLGRRWLKEPEVPFMKHEFLLAMLPLGVLFLTFFVKFAPWEWDNTKLMVWCYLMLIVPIWEVLKKLGPIVSSMALVMLFASGFVTLFTDLNPRQNGMEFSNLTEIHLTRRMVRHVPADATIAAAPDFDHPLLLCGRPLVMGYEGHLMSHGANYLEKKQLLWRLMNGDPAWKEIARILGVRFLFWSRFEENTWPNSSKPWSNCRVVETSTFGTIFALE